MTTFLPTILASILLSTLLVLASAIPRGHVGHVRSHIPVAEAENQAGDYDDFSDLPMNYVRQAYNIPHSITNQKLLDEFQVPKNKRYRKCQLYFWNILGFYNMFAKYQFFSVEL